MRKITENSKAFQIKLLYKAKTRNICEIAIIRGQSWENILVMEANKNSLTSKKFHNNITIRKIQSVY